MSAKTGDGVDDMMTELTKTIDVNVIEEEVQETKLQNEGFATKIFGSENCC